jgi:hypothetical protein
VAFPDRDELVRLPGYAGPATEELLGFVLCAEQAGTQERLRELRERHEKLAGAFVEATTPGMRAAIAKQAGEVEEQITRLSSGLRPAADELREIHREIEAAAVAVRRAETAMVEEDYATLAQAAQALIERVDCEYETVSFPSGYSYSRLTGVRITPRFGKPELRQVPRDREGPLTSSRTQSPQGTVPQDETPRPRCRSPTRRCTGRRWRQPSGS